MKIFSALINGRKTVNEEIDFSENIKNHDTILDIEKCFVNGKMYFKNEQLYTELAINVKLVLASSRSLKPIDYNLNFDLDLIFGSSKAADYELTKEIDLGEIIFGHILLEKPLAIYLDDETPQEIKKDINPAFKDLKDWDI